MATLVRESEDFREGGYKEKQLQEARKMLKSQNFFRAIEVYTELAVNTPLDPEYFINRSLAFTGIGNHNNAIIDAKVALQLVGTDITQASYALAKAFYGHGDYSRAEESVLAALNVDAKNTKLLDLYQSIQRKLKGDPDHVDTIDWVQRDASGKMINHEHDHGHDSIGQTHSHDHDHEHGHGHDHSHTSDHHSHDHEPVRRRSLSGHSSSSERLPRSLESQANTRSDFETHHSRIDNAVEEFYSSAHSHDHGHLHGSFRK